MELPQKPRALDRTRVGIVAVRCFDPALSPSIADRCRRTGRLVHPFGEPQVVVESRDSRADIRDEVYALRFEA
jgi:hypothetical protein